MVAIVLALLMVLSACSSAPPTGPAAAKSLIDASAAAMGGWAALDAVKSQEIITGGQDLEPLQAMEPSGQPPRLINNFGQTITVDYEKNRMRLSFDAVREYPARNPLKFAEVIDGDAGMLVTSDVTVAEKSRMLRNYGQRENYSSEILGGNSRLDELQAALLRVKLHHLDAWNDRRRAIAARYAEAIRHAAMCLPCEAPWARHVYHLYVIRTPRRDAKPRLLRVLRLVDLQIDDLEGRPEQCPEPSVVVDQQEPHAIPLSR